MKKDFWVTRTRTFFCMPLWMPFWGRRPLGILESISRTSVKLLEHVGALLEENLFLIENIDATIIAQAPKMRPHIDAMRKNIAQALGITVEQVNVKATTEEGLGFTGTGEGISAQAVCLLTSPVSLGSEDVTTRGCGGCEGCPVSEQY